MCNRAFSTVVADTQFSALGVVLIAALARIGKICGLPKAKATTVDSHHSVSAGTGSEPIENHVGGGTAGSRGLSEDMGKVVQRNAVREDQRSHSSEEVGRVSAPLNMMHALEHQCKAPKVQKTTMKEREESSSSARPVKRRKKTNAIDDLFGGLL